MSEETYDVKLQELYEIADGAFSDGPYKRGLAIEKIRKMGHNYPADAPSPQGSAGQ